MDALPLTVCVVTAMQVLHPPVTIPWQPGMTRGVHKNIVMVGRFFSGRQSKGHPNAIRLFAELYTSLPNDTRLVMVRDMWPVHTSTHDKCSMLLCVCMYLLVGHCCPAYIGPMFTAPSLRGVCAPACVAHECAVVPLLRWAILQWVWRGTSTTFGRS